MTSTDLTDPVAGVARRTNVPTRRAQLRPPPRGSRLAQAAAGVGLLFAALSGYWVLGGTWLVDTLGRSFEDGARDRDRSFLLLVGAAAVLKATAAVLPLVALRRVASPAWNRLVWVLSWIVAAVLTVYGLVYTGVGLLVQAGAIGDASGGAHRSLAWHAYLWDPWFLLWGLLVCAALLRGRHGRRQTPSPG